MSQINTVVNYDDLAIDDLLELDGIDEGIVAAIESVHIVYQGLLATPASRYAEPDIQKALVRRLETISAGTGVSLEGITISIENIDTLVVSQEADFVGVIETIVTKIMEWLGRIKEFFLGLWRKVFNRKTAVVAAAKANNVKYEATVKSYASNNKTIPTTVKCTVPGRCYVLFHAKPHLPKAGFVYNQAGLDKALDSVPKEIDKIIDAMSAETDTTLKAVRMLMQAMDRPAGAVIGPKGSVIRSLDEPLKDLKTNRKMFGLFHDKFEVIGMGVIAKPLRHANKYHSEKFALTDTSRNYGWGTVDSFDITLDVNKIKDLNDNVAKNATDKLSAIAGLVDRVIKSSEISDLVKKLKDQRTVNQLVGLNTPENGSITVNESRNNLERLELMTEYVNQLTDNLSLLYQFYARYIEILSVISQRAVSELQNYS